MKLLGYGEDFLTLWALTTETDKILSKLDDDTPSELCTVIYRPSFGRAGGSMENQRAEFGEFDAILISDHKAYLIESKWDGGGIRKRRIKLEKNQVKRHKIFDWYHKNWKKQLDWSKLIEEKTSEFQQLFPENKIAPTRSILKGNINEVLSLITRKPLQNVLMYFHSGNPQEIREKYDEVKFTKLLIQYNKIHNLVEINY
jgi:hypothetical protein